MNENNIASKTARPRGLRLTLLATVASVGMAVLVAGPIGYQVIPMMTSPAHAAELAQNMSGFADLVAKVKPSVISVQVRMDRPADQVNGTFGMRQFMRPFGFGNTPDPAPQRRQVTGEGSGFFISADGYAVTNNHVVDHAKSVSITTDDGTDYTAKVIGTDPKSDLALIKIDAAGKTFPFVKFADHEPRIGDWVVAVGNPFGLGGTVTAGIVSARGRDIGAGPYDDYIQIDAPINKGNSGGPAFDASGNVIGVNTAIYSPSGGSVGIGFDIPADTAKLVVDQLKEKGSVTRGWMGVQVQAVTPEIANSLAMDHARGAIVDTVQGPAAKAGIVTGDVVTAINGEPIKDSRDLARKIALIAPGTSVNLDVWHDGKSKTVAVSLGKMPGEQQAKADNAESSANSTHLGLALAPADQVEGSGGKGLVVTGVDPDSSAAQHGVETGDVILDVSGKAVKNLSDIRTALSDAKSHGRHDVLMRVKTSDGTRFIALPLES